MSFEFGQDEGSQGLALRRYGFKDVYTAQDIQAWQPPSYPFAKVDPKWAEAGAIRVSLPRSLHLSPP